MSIYIVMISITINSIVDREVDTAEVIIAEEQTDLPIRPRVSQ